MIAADHDRRLDLALANQLVDRKPGTRPVAVAKPADPSRQTLEGDPAGSDFEPALKGGVIGKEPAQRLVDHRDVRLLTGESRPAKRPDALGE